MGRKVTLRRIVKALVDMGVAALRQGKKSKIVVDRLGLDTSPCVGQRRVTPDVVALGGRDIFLNIGALP